MFSPSRGSLFHPEKQQLHSGGIAAIARPKSGSARRTDRNGKPATSQRRTQHMSGISEGFRDIASSAINDIGDTGQEILMADASISPADALPGTMEQVTETIDTAAPEPVELVDTPQEVMEQTGPGIDYR
jgi:hypothetical protein